MRIQNNITAMNTHRMYTINNDNVAKSAEKLSSGYRINRAGDDAAGLAISEKMRSQIRGLNMATKNSQDAISLVQTAEGALQETHSMLQRMNELAVQAATGTNEDLDRTALAKEFEQLKKEINDVAEQTNFNNMKILDGSMSYEGYVRSAATAGVTNTVTAESNPTAGALTQTDFKGSSEPIAQGTGTLTSANTAANTTGLAANDKYQIEIELEDGTKLTSGILTATGTTFKELTDDLRAATDKKLYVDVNGVKTDSGATIDRDGTTNGTVKVDGTGGALTDRVLDLNNAKISIIKHDSPSTGEDGKKVGELANGTVGGNGKVNGAIAGVGASATYELDASKVSYGDTFTVDGTTYEIVEKAADATKGTAVVWDGKNGKDLVAALAKEITNTGGNVTAAQTGEKTLTITNANAPTANGGATNGAEANDKSVTMTSGGAADANKGITNTIEFDIAKMKDGDQFTIKTSKGDVTVTFNEGDDRQGFMDKVAAEAKNQGVGEVKGNALIVKDAEVKSIDLKSGNLKETNAIRIQVGANEHEMLSISIDSMNTAGLKLDDQFLTKVGNSVSQDQDLAGKAITAVKNAINKVSDQRATLGAMQNRLDHKIANLKVSSENLSAAESRIRDVDMASEMTNFTKNNILSQAATAMLAQANSLPQNVLSLLG